MRPSPAPSKLLFSGLNYRSHTEENPGAVLPTYPQFFAKLPSAIIGPGEAIVLPTPETQVDYEVELAVVIGRTTRDRALDHVFGYTVVNDVSARDAQPSVKMLGASDCSLALRFAARGGDRNRIAEDGRTAGIVRVRRACARGRRRDERVVARVAQPLGERLHVGFGSAD